VLQHYLRYLELLRTGAAPPARYRGAWIDLDRVARFDLLDAVGVRYLIAPASMESARLTLERIAPRQLVFVFYSGLRRRDLSIWRNASELPRARWVQRVLYAKDEDAAAARLEREDARETAIVIGEGSDREIPQTSDQPQLTSWAPGEVTVAARSDRERFLLFAEVWHLGWRATIDGSSAPLLRADLALMGLWVPAGEHRMIFRFRPLFWPLALGITIVSAALCAGLLAWTRLRST
jgi:hypothetical protein